jgi:hypothetical protein
MSIQCRYALNRAHSSQPDISRYGDHDRLMNDPSSYSILSALLLYTTYGASSICDFKGRSCACNSSRARFLSSTVVTNPYPIAALLSGLSRLHWRSRPRQAVRHCLLTTSSASFTTASTALWDGQKCGWSSVCAVGFGRTAGAVSGSASEYCLT